MKVRMLSAALLMIASGCAVCPFCGKEKLEPVKLTKLGTYDMFIVEANPVVFKGKLWMMEYIRWERSDKRYRFNNTGDSYFRFRDMSGKMDRFTPAFANGLHMGCAFVEGDTVYVTAVNKWGGTRYYIMESQDLENWSEPRLILENPAWEGYNSTMCKAGDRYVLSFELGEPIADVKEPFTMYFAESKDLKEFKVVEGAKMGDDRYTGAPMLRWFDGWFYYFHLEGTYETGFKTRVARSRDLYSWQFSDKVVLDYTPEDKLIHPNAYFTEEERRYIAAAKDVNASDLDMCYFDGKLRCFYSWGNQRGNEFSALAEADCTAQEFCESFFK